MWGRGEVSFIEGLGGVIFYWGVRGREALLGGQEE